MSSALALLLALAAPAVIAAPADAASTASDAACAKVPVLTKDVVVIGGGGSGTYGAIRAREDYKKSIALIEIAPQLGGHVNTYDDPVSGAAIEFGVESYVDYGKAKDFFARFNIPIQPAVQYASTSYTADPSNGAVLFNYSAPSFLDGVEACAKYYGLIKPYDKYLLPGYWNFPAPSQIPSDFLLLWPDYVAKYGLQNMTAILKLVAGVEGRPDEAAVLTMMNFGTPVVGGLLNNTLFDPVPYNNSILYAKAQQLLGKDAYVSSWVSKTVRTSQGVSVTVSNSSGPVAVINAKQLLISAQPSLGNLANMSLTAAEVSMFSTWAPSASFVGVVRTAGIPDNTTLDFESANGAALPYNFQLFWTGYHNLFHVVFNSQQLPPLTNAQAQSTVLSVLQKVVKTNSLNAPVTSTSENIQLVAWADHSTVRHNETVAQLKAGYIQKLMALQGQESTWYTGGLWAPDYQTNVWAFTDTVLARMFGNKTGY